MSEPSNENSALVLVGLQSQSAQTRPLTPVAVAPVEPAPDTEPAAPLPTAASESASVIHRAYWYIEEIKA